MSTHDVFLPITPDDQVLAGMGGHQLFKIRIRYQPEAHAWLEHDLQFDIDWFSLLDIQDHDYEYYYFVDESQAMRFLLTWG